MPEQGPVDVNVMGLAVEKMTAQVVISQDELIAVAITNAIGDGWTIASLTGRIARKVLHDRVEVVELDGKEILEMHPIRFEKVMEGGSINLKSVQDYRILRSNADRHHKVNITGDSK